MAQSQRIAVYSISELKNTTDDALSPYLRHQEKFVQNYMLSDIRLVLGYTAVAIAAVTFYFDYKLTWDATKGWTTWAVIAYFVINSILTLWIWGVEKGKIFNGSRGHILVSISSHVNKFDPIYRLRARYSDPSDPAGLEGRSIEIEAPFTKWFTTDGNFITENFHNWLASALPFLKDGTAKARG